MAVRDVDEHHALPLEFAQLVKHDLHLRVIQRRGGLIEHQQPGPLVNGLAEFQHLPLGHGQLARILIGIDVGKADFRKQAAGQVAHRLRIEQKALLLFAAQKQVLRNGEHRVDAQLLVNR